MKLKSVFLSLAFSSLAFSVGAQQATMARNAILHTGSSASSKAIQHLKSGASVSLLDTKPENGYFHVKAEDGQEGWVWSKDIAIDGSTPAARHPAGSTSTADNNLQCDRSLWNHVYNHQRLLVNNPCIAVTGTIVDASNGKWADGVRHEPDGDTHGWLQVDSQFANLLNAGNKSSEGGNLVFEIVCKFPVTQPDAKASCPSSYHSPVQIPPIGAHVRIVGSYVQDTNHAKWMEIHPVSSIEVLPNSQ